MLCRLREGPLGGSPAWRCRLDDMPREAGALRSTPATAISRAGHVSSEPAQAAHSSIYVCRCGGGGRRATARASGGAACVGMPIAAGWAKVADVHSWIHSAGPRPCGGFGGGGGKRRRRGCRTRTPETIGQPWPRTHERGASLRLTGLWGSVRAACCMLRAACVTGAPGLQLKPPQAYPALRRWHGREGHEVCTLTRAFTGSEGEGHLWSVFTLAVAEAAACVPV